MSGLIVGSILALILAITTTAHAQYGDPFSLEPLDPYDPLYNSDSSDFMDDYYERRERTRARQQRQRELQEQPLPFFNLNEPYDTQDALRAGERQNCDFMTGNPAAQALCYERLR